MRAFEKERIDHWLPPIHKLFHQFGTNHGAEKSKETEEIESFFYSPTITRVGTQIFHSKVNYFILTI